MIQAADQEIKTRFPVGVTRPLSPKGSIRNNLVWHWGPTLAWPFRSFCAGREDCRATAANVRSANVGRFIGLSLSGSLNEPLGLLRVVRSGRSCALACGAVAHLAGLLAVVRCDGEELPIDLVGSARDSQRVRCRPHPPFTISADGTSRSSAAAIFLHRPSAADQRRDREPKPRRNPRWPAAALVAALALNGLWVALLLWLVGRWIGAV